MNGWLNPEVNWADVYCAPIYCVPAVAEGYAHSKQRALRRLTDLAAPAEIFVVHDERPDREFTTIDEVHHITRSDPKKVLSLLYLQKLEAKGNNRTELRLGYYTPATKTARIKAKWI
jgi:hypothetical protein